jgi:hypothetical protein
MRAVTPIYYAKRRYNVRGLLGWSAQNEIRLYGYLTVYRPWEMTPRRGFSIARWLYPDGSAAYYGYDEPMPRYSELRDFPLNVWGAVRQPWEEEPVNPVEQFHTPDEQQKYLDRKLDKALDHLNHGTAMVMHLPYGGLPLVSVTSKEGKVTIY